MNVTKLLLKHVDSVSFASCQQKDAIKSHCLQSNIFHPNPFYGRFRSFPKKMNSPLMVFIPSIYLVRLGESVPSKKISSSCSVYSEFALKFKTPQDENIKSHMVLTHAGFVHLLVKAHRRFSLHFPKFGSTDSRKSLYSFKKNNQFLRRFFF